MRYGAARPMSSVGGAMALETTASNAPARSGCSDRTASALPWKISTSASPSSRLTVERKETRLRRASTRVRRIPSSAILNGNPGIPAPVPISATLIGRLPGRRGRNSKASWNRPLTIAVGVRRAVRSRALFQTIKSSRYRENLWRCPVDAGWPVRAAMAEANSSTGSRALRGTLTPPRGGTDPLSQEPAGRECSGLAFLVTPFWGPGLAPSRLSRCGPYNAAGGSAGHSRASSRARALTAGSGT